MKVPEEIEPTPEELIEREIYAKYNPITMKQAIHNTIWYMREQLKKEASDGIRD